MKNLLKRTFKLKESNCTVITDKEQAITAAIESIRLNRKQLEGYIKTNPKFLVSLVPIQIPAEPLVAKLMAEAAEKAGVGPMAAVAGVLADLAVESMVSKGSEVAVVENGGEISVSSKESVDVAVAAGDEPLSKRFGFRLTKFPIGVATSSGRFSHALSFGDAEAVTVFCSNAGLADAAATAIGNIVKGEDPEAAIQSGIKKAQTIQGVEGTIVLFKSSIGTWGKIPQIIKINSDSRAQE
ncbi:TPA: UPF0280 family protein [Candidatus Bathyarchaeota archaeon]|nr:UPF0280 family protein [Candidatus Bathyarchaeota archaeon]